MPRLFLAPVLAACLAVAALGANADDGRGHGGWSDHGRSDRDYDRPGHDWHDHDTRDHRWGGHDDWRFRAYEAYRPVGYPVYGYYAPRPIYIPQPAYVPQSVYAQPVDYFPPSLAIGLNFR